MNNNLLNFEIKILKEGPVIQLRTLKIVIF